MQNRPEGLTETGKKEYFPEQYITLKVYGYDRRFHFGLTKSGIAFTH